MKRNQINFKEVEDPCFEAAKLVASDKIVGWFQGRLEFGPRALGNRSILANPANKDMKNIVNKIKFRESFRPFCPSVLEEDANLYFNGNIKEAPYMAIAFDVREKHKTKIPSVTHIDGTARVQTVNKGQKSNVLFIFISSKRVNWNRYDSKHELQCKRPSNCEYT